AIQDSVAVDAVDGDARDARSGVPVALDRLGPCADDAALRLASVARVANHAVRSVYLDRGSVADAVGIGGVVADQVVALQVEVGAVRETDGDTERAGEIARQLTVA